MRSQQHEPSEGERYGKLKRYTALKTRLICGGLIGIGVVILQAFISTGVFMSVQSAPTAKVPTVVKVLDWPALVSVIAFAIALPLLSALLLLTFVETSRKYIVKSDLGLRLVYWAGTIPAVIGIVFAFWHIWPVVGILAAVSTAIGTAVFTGYCMKLARLDKQLKAKWNIENIRSEEDELP